MDLALLIARLLLAGVFAVAGAAKLVDPSGSRQAMRDFGVPVRLAAPLGFLLPLAEIAVAVALVPKGSAWWGALGALALLLLFVIGIGANMARGKRPDCHCFGPLHSAPAGWTTLARNAVLAAIAGFVVWRAWDNPGHSAVAWMTDLSTAEQVGLLAGLLVFGLLAAGGWAIVQLLGQNGRLLVRLDSLEAALNAGGGVTNPARIPIPTESELGLPVGAPAPGFSLPGLYGETLTLDALRAAGQPVLLVFSDTGCAPCHALMPELGRLQREQADRITVALLSRGTPEANRPKTSAHGLNRVLLQQDREVAESYQAEGTPIGVVVHADGTIGSPLALGADAIRSLIARAVGTPGSPVPASPAVPTPGVAPSNGTERNGSNSGESQALPAVTKVGDRAPIHSFPSVTGRPVSVADFRGHRTLVLFWDPGCGYCTEMLPDLQSWETNPPGGAPKLLLISTGTEEVNRALGIQAPIALDQAFAAGTAFGATGTPSAILVDGDGRIASEVAVGAKAVLAMARGEAPNAAPTPANGATVPTPPKVGDPAPPLSLPDLSGKTVNLAEFEGDEVQVLFWNPGCGFCARMLDDLKTWEANPPPGAPKVLVVSTGTVETNLAMGLGATVVLDQGFRTGTDFGAGGTPSAVRIDAQGRIASALTVGAPAVLALAHGETPSAAAATSGIGTAPPASA
ncbi:MAG: redoxin domain-containing protein [Gemmatimonadota bacterium]|nr:redoxin domain-containing protein [Gemmatimonadota bacterium]